MKVFRDIDSNNFPVFAKKEFLASRSDEYGWLGMHNSYIPYIIDKRLIFRRLIFTNAVFSLAEEGPLETKAFLESAVDKIKNELNVDFIAKAQGNVVFDKTPLGCISAEWGTYQKKITAERDDLMTSMNSKTRNMIRRGIKEELEVEKCSVEELHEILERTFSRQRESILCPSLEYLERLKNNLQDNFLMLKCSKDKIIQCAVGIPYDNDTGYYLYGGSVDRPAPGSMNLLQFETMIALAQKGVKKYDFVGARMNTSKDSKYYGIQKFKKSFDPELIEGLSFKVVFNKPKYMLFQILVKIAYLLKGGRYFGDPIDQIRKENQK